jgi:hypothetical protein
MLNCTKVNGENLVMLKMYIQYTFSYLVSKHTEFSPKQQKFQRKSTIFIKLLKYKFVVYVHLPQCSSSNYH